MPRILDTTVRTVRVSYTRGTCTHVLHVHTVMHTTYSMYVYMYTYVLYMYHVQQYSTHVHVPCMYT